MSGLNRSTISRLRAKPSMRGDLGALALAAFTLKDQINAELLRSSGKARKRQAAA